MESEAVDGEWCQQQQKQRQDGEGAPEKQLNFPVAGTALDPESPHSFQSMS